MNIEAIGNLGSMVEVKTDTTRIEPSQVQDTSAFMDAVNQLNTTVVEADMKVQEFVINPSMDVQEVMLAMEQARLMMEMAVQVRNKAVEAAQQLLRMQI